LRPCCKAFVPFNLRQKSPSFPAKTWPTGPYSLNKNRVYIDGGKSERLESDRFFTIIVPAGKHIVGSGAGALIARREHLELDLKPGEHVYILEGLEMGMWRGRLALRGSLLHGHGGMRLAKQIEARPGFAGDQI
jgi:hypothetical protein